MPQASDEQRAAWGGRDGVCEDKAEGYLTGRGYKLTSRWNWLVPEGQEVTEQDKEAAAFLVDEWDWGWFVTELRADEEVR